jgi:hypothetical protein
LHPRVLVTGVAGLTTNGRDHRVAVTSFGTLQQAPPAPGAEDFVDFGHLQRIDHSEFALTYPATWMLGRGVLKRRDGVVQTEHVARVGGTTCAITLSVSVCHGSSRQIERHRRDTVGRLSAPVPGPLGLLSPTPQNVNATTEGVRPFAFDLRSDQMDGLAVSTLLNSDAGERLGQVHAFGCVSKTLPRRAEVLDEMRRTFEEIIRSFRLA